MNETLTSALWFLGRGTGMVALVMLTLTLMLGITARSGRPALGLPRFAVADLHRTASLIGASLIALHVGSLFFDPYAQLRLVDLALPFLGAYRPIYLGLGTVALDVLALLVVTGLLRHRIGPTAFRLVHWSAYAMWPLALAHAVGIGSDRATSWFVWTAAACVGAVAGALTWRLSASFGERGRQRVPRRVVAR